MRAVLAIAALLAVAAPLSAQAAPRENTKCTPNPVFEKFPNSLYHSCERSRFFALKLLRARDPRKLSGPHDEFTREGEYWYYFDFIQRDRDNKVPSRLEVFRNYEAALKAAGGDILYADGTKSFVYRIERPSGEYWGQVGCGAGSAAACDRIQHKIVRVAAMEQAVVVSADQIRKSLADTGKVVFYGIYFDTDRATLKPESGPTLAEMAKFLETNGKARVFIVGHTDMQGPLDRNERLSRERAASVVAALADRHGIAKDRMTPAGVGPLAPVAANEADAGRAKNRRVEMVLR